MSQTVILWVAGTAFSVIGGLLLLILRLVALVYKRLEEDRKNTDSRLSNCQSRHSVRDGEVFGHLRNHGERIVAIESRLPTNHGHPYAGSPAE